MIRDANGYKDTVLENSIGAPFAVNEMSIGRQFCGVLKEEALGCQVCTISL
jgi:hypothetical protein